MITLWRITNREFQESAFSGEGTFRRGGRWISPGRSAVFMSDSLALASQEFLINIPMEYRVVPQLVYIQAEITDDLVLRIVREGLPAGWDGIPYNRETQELGNRWFDRGESLALCVPSALLPVGDNFIINPSHPAFPSLRRQEPKEFVIDARTAAILDLSLGAFFPGMEGVKKSGRVKKK